MSATEENNTRMNFYVLAQQGDDSPPPHKKQKCYNDPSTSSSQPHRVTRILGRRYALTSASYKHLDIAIRVGPVASVELILGDNRGNEFILPIRIWKELLQKREEIEELIESPLIEQLWVRELLIDFVIIKGTDIVKLKLFDNTIYLRPTTLTFLWNLEHCINHMYSWLCENTHLVTMKFNKFVDIIQRAHISDVRAAAKAIRESDVFDVDSLIDCELVAYAINDIIYNVQKKR